MFIVYFGYQSFVFLHFVEFGKIIEVRLNPKVNFILFRCSFCDPVDISVLSIIVQD